MKQSTIIIDSSIIAKWFLEDEEEKESALKIKEDYLQGDISIALPSITFYEVSNFLKMAVSRLRIEKHSAYNAYKRFLEFDFEVYFSNELLEANIYEAITHNITSYDASYVVLAEYLKIPFYTADRKLLQKTKGEYVYHLREYLLK